MDYSLFAVISNYLKAKEEARKEKTEAKAKGQEANNQKKKKKR